MGFLVTLTGLCGLLPSWACAEETDSFTVPEKIEYLLEDHCWKCHDAGTSKGNIELDNIGKLGFEERLDLLNKMHEQVFLEHMPPRKEKTLPTDEERGELIAWIEKDLKKHGATTLYDKLKRPEYGNYVEHGKLFSGDYSQLPGSTEDRRWLISEFIFKNKLGRFNRGAGLVGIPEITNPFLLPEVSGVRDYATRQLDGGHLLTMIGNARSLSEHVMQQARKNPATFPEIAAIMQQVWVDEAVVGQRVEFLNTHIERVLVDLYGEQDHLKQLPTFVAVEIQKTKKGVSTRVEGKKQKLKKGEVKRPLFGAVKLSDSEMRHMSRTIGKLQSKAGTDEELLSLCEKEWFRFGDSPQTIRQRLTFLQEYLPDWRGFLQAQRRGKELFEAHPAYEPLAAGDMEAIKKSLRSLRKPGDTYHGLIAKAKQQWEEEFLEARIRSGSIDQPKIDALISSSFEIVLERSPSSTELESYRKLFDGYLRELGQPNAIGMILETLIISSEFAYRHEFGQGAPDSHGRRMLSSRDAAYAISYALTDRSPDDNLLQAAATGKLSTREDYAREVKRILGERKYLSQVEAAGQANQMHLTRMPVRKIRFFREFFGYPNLGTLFKDNKRFGANYGHVPWHLVHQCDLLVEHILNEDKHVFEELLTTGNFYVFHNGDNKAAQEDVDRMMQIYEVFKDKDISNYDANTYTAEFKSLGLTGKGTRPPIMPEDMQTIVGTVKDRKATPTPISYTGAGPKSLFVNRKDTSRGPTELLRLFNLEVETWDYPAKQPAKMPSRGGILTHPAWLIAFSRNFETDIIHRGKWVREKLLAGTIPDVPITVDASIPEDHTKTMRTRVSEKTEESYCWKCHEHMNPLGYAFEMYDDFGRFRTSEPLEHPDNLIEEKRGLESNIYKSLPIETGGHLSGTGDASLDGEVKDAIDLSQRLAKSARVRQSIIRPAFRFFMGRNEVLSDSKTLIDADEAYVGSGGSFDAVIVSLLTSDSFIYRKSTTTE